MFKSNTVFVLGAGASNEVGLPIGATLAKQIKDLTTIKKDAFGNITAGGIELFRAVCAQFPNRNSEITKAASLISNGIDTANSIDDFLERHANDHMAVAYGKTAIGWSILQAERKSKLYVDTRKERDVISFERVALADTWYFHLAKLLATGVNRDNVSDFFNNVQFIDFNYDRCLERFFFQWLPKAYSLNIVDTNNVLGKIRIHKPYGSVGNLSSGMDSLAFGYEPPSDTNFTDRLRLYSEGGANKTTIKVAQEALARADVLVFLGFAFHEPNMELIAPGAGSGIKRPNRRIFATAFDMSDPNVDAIGNDIRSRLGPLEVEPQVRNDLKCAQLMTEFSKLMTSR